MSDESLLEQFRVLTVEWCNDSHRGIFFHPAAQHFYVQRASEPVPDDERLWEILDAFVLILAPRWELMTRDEIGDHIYYRPLAEFENEWGIILRPDKLTAEERSKCDGNNEAGSV